jgi:hypothetical protein
MEQFTNHIEICKTTENLVNKKDKFYNKKT